MAAPQTRYCTQCHQTFPDSDTRFCPMCGGAIVAEEDRGDPMVGRKLGGRYLLLRRIGRGGMGEVYEADHVGLDKRVAVKFLLDKFDTDREVVTRFHREARTASKIGHANIIDITDIGETDDGRPYIVMELLQGEDLGDLLRRSGPLSLVRTVNIVKQICRGLQAAHDLGIVHRDMKPENVFLTQRDDQVDVVKIMDFGISKVIDAHDSKVRLTQTGAVVGTPIYMAPEQATASHDVDHRADVYATGIMFFELLCGQPPFTGTSYLQLVTQHMHEPPPRPSTLRRDVPPGVEQLILHALEKAPDKRLPDMRTFEQRLPAVPALSPSMVADPQPVHMSAGGPPGAYAAPTAMPTQSFRRNLKTPLVIVAAAGAIAAGMLAYGYLSGNGEPIAAAPAPTAAPAPAPAAVPDAGSTVRSDPLPMGSLEIDSVPTGADVFFDGEPAGVTPLKLADVRPGIHLIRLEKSGFAPLEAQKPVREGYSETFFGALATTRSGGRSKVKRGAPATKTAPPAPPTPPGPEPTPTPTPTPEPKATPPRGDGDHKENPFDKDRKSNPFAE